MTSKLLLVSLIGSVGAALTNTSPAAGAVTTAIGYNTVQCLANSDTVVSIPFANPVYLGSILSVSGNQITIKNTPNFTANQFVYQAGTQSKTYYVFFRGGFAEGSYYTITANTSNVLTVDLAGDSLATVTPDTGISIIPYWTLADLFKDADVGSAFVASTDFTTPNGTEILIPDNTALGIGIPYGNKYYYYNGDWRLRTTPTQQTISRNDDILLPDSLLAIRNHTGATVFRPIGQVVMNRLTIPLATQAAAKQDNAIGLARPVPVSLNDSGLVSSGAFTASPSSASHTDELLLYDNDTPVLNKPPTASYYYFNGAWRKDGDLTVADVGATTFIEPGEGFLIRKYNTPGGVTRFFSNARSFISAGADTLLVSAVSRKIHGAAGTWDVPLPVTGGIGLEPRTGNSVGNVFGARTHTLVMTFSSNVTAGTATVAPGSVGTVSGSPTFSGNQMSVDLTGVTNATTFTLNLSGVTVSPGGTVLAPMSVRLDLMAADVNGSHTVNGTDVLQVKAQVGQTLNYVNFTRDVNATGTVNGSDVLVTKARVGTPFN